MSIADHYAVIAAEESDIQDHLPFLRSCAEQYAAPTIIELGVRTGRSTAAFLAGLGAGHLWSIDTQPPEVPPVMRDPSRWSFLLADDMEAAAILWLPAETDILFIDTSHHYEHTVKELALYAPRVRPGGLILMHDTEYQPDGTYISPEDSAVGVALTHYCALMGLKWENMTGCFGLGVVRVR